MLRAGASRSLLRSVTSSSVPLVRTSHNAAFLASRAVATASRALVISKRQPSTTTALTKFHPFTTSLQRSATTASGTVYDHIDHEAEMKIARQPLRPTDEEEVSADSSMVSVLEERQDKSQEGKYPDVPDETDMLAGVKNDLVRSPMPVLCL